MKRFSILYIGAAVFALTAKTQASDDFLVPNTTAGNQHYQDVALDDAGGFLIVWESDPTWAIGRALGRRYDADGNATGSEYLLADQVPGEAQRAPRICHRAGGGWVVIWRNTHIWGQSSEPAARQGIFARFLAEDGTPTGTAIRVSSDAPRVTDLDVTCLPDGGLFAAWDNNLEDGSYYDIFGQYVDEAGNLVGAEVQVNTETEGAQGNFGDIRVASSSGGKVLVLWPSNCPMHVGSVECTVEPDGSASSAQARLFDENRNPTGPEFRVNTATLGSQGSYGMAAAFDENEGFIIVFTSGDTNPALCGDAIPCGDLLAQRYDSAGAPVGGETAVNAVIRGNQVYPDVVYDGDGRYLVVWHHAPPYGTDALDAIAGRFIGPDGGVGGSEFRVTSDESGDNAAPRIASHAGSYVVAWTNFDRGDRKVFARRLSGALPECPEIPADDCSGDDGSTILFRAGGSSPSRLAWKWGAARTASTADPQGDLTGYSLCIYEGTDTLVSAASARSFAECAMGACWSGKNGRYRFRRSKGAAFAVSSLSVHNGSDAIKLRVKASGTGSPMTRMHEMTAPLVVQLISSDGHCWEAAYDDMTMGATSLKARSR